MSAGKKIRVAVLYGGRSGEHEISLRSAASILQNLDPERFEVVPVAIDKQGRWHLNDVTLLTEQAKATGVLPVYRNAPELALPPYPQVAQSDLMTSTGSVGASVDVVFPIMHGPLCEDGSIQGLFELADIAYVGSGVLGSAVGMDKDVAKRLARDAGLPIVPFVTITRASWKKSPSELHAQVKRELGFPCFVKPANMGSSVGVHKVKTEAEFATALKDSLRYDTKVLVEKAIAAREIEVAILENSVVGEPPLASVVGEIIPQHEFYSYEAKYLDENGAALRIPAALTEVQSDAVRELARKVFTTLNLEGLSRVDFFIDRDTDALYFNEVNTMPGFTTISMYPKMWEATGISYSELLTRLIELALRRHEERQSLLREYAPS